MKEKFGELDPHNPKYKKAEDLPEAIREHYINEGEGFVEKSASALYHEEVPRVVKKKEMSRKMKDPTFIEAMEGVFRELFNKPIRVKEPSMDRILEAIQEFAHNKEPWEAYAENKRILLRNELLGAEWDKMRKTLPNPEDRMYVEFSKARAYNAFEFFDIKVEHMFGVVDGKEIDFSIGDTEDLSSFRIDNQPIDAKSGMEIVRRLKPAAIRLWSVEVQCEDLMNKFENETTKLSVEHPSRMNQRTQAIIKQTKEDRKQGQQEQALLRAAGEAANNAILGRIAQAPKE